jgi:hypothetical protein
MPKLTWMIPSVRPFSLCLTKYDRVHKKIFKTKYTSKLNLHIDNTCYDRLSLKRVRAIIRSCSSLKKVHISYSWPLLMRKNHFRLFKVLKSTKSLTYFIANFQKCSRIDDSSLFRLMRLLALFRNLQSFGLNISGCNKVTQKGLEFLFSGLKGVVKCKMMYLDLKGLAVSSDDLSILESKLSHWVDLQHLKIKTSTHEISSVERNLLANNSTRHDLEKILKENSSISICLPLLSTRMICALRKLCLSFGRGLIGESTVGDLARIIKRSTSLEKLKLSFHDYWANDEILKSFGYAISELELKGLDIALSKCAKTTIWGFLQLSQEVGKIHTLKKLNLSIIDDFCYYYCYCLVEQVSTLNLKTLKLHGRTVNRPWLHSDPIMELMNRSIKLMNLEKFCF